MTDVKCPRGMVLIQPKGAVYPNEPKFCIMKTEVPQKDDNRFWAGRMGKGFELLILLSNGSKKSIVRSQKAPLLAIAAKLEKEELTKMRNRRVDSFEVRPVTGAAIPKYSRKLAEPRKPAVFRTWYEARKYCRSVYRGGDLPTWRQWKNACGRKRYCTRSGRLNHAEAIYSVSGPANVGSTLSNARGVYDMTGNVWEYLRDVAKHGKRFITGGSWGIGIDTNYTPRQRPAARRLFSANYRDGSIRPNQHGGGVVGFRCVAPPLTSAAQPARVRAKRR